MDGKGEFQYVENPEPLGPEPTLPQPDPRLHGTLKTPQAQSIANGGSSIVDRVVKAIDDITPGSK